MYRCKIDIHLKIAAPFLSQSSSPGAFGFDILQARNRDKKIVLPGTLIAGRLRQAWDELHTALEEADHSELKVVIPSTEDIALLLGSEPKDGSFDPHRKQLVFTDFICITNEDTNQQQKLRTRIAIDQDRGAVAKGALIVMEAPFASGSSLCFEGSVRFDAANEEKADEIKQAIIFGLQWVPQFGGFASTGFGRLQEVCVLKTETNPLPVEAAPAEATEFALVFQPETPFCIAERPVAGNIFTSRKEIPGGVIKGALAKTLQQLLEEKSAEDRQDLKLLNTYLDKIVFTHAFPAKEKTKRPVQLPLSLVKPMGDSTLYDFALYNNSILPDGRVPEFQVDWKAEEDEHFGWPEINREIRVHTAIENDKNRHKHGSLFSYEMVVPDDLYWLGRVDLSRVDAKDRTRVTGQLKTVLQSGLASIGKTKSFLRCELIHQNKPASAVPEKALQETGNTVIFTLQTAALLLDYKEVQKVHQQGETLDKVYNAVWHELSDCSLQLKRFFARQSLSGGAYQYHHFQKGKAYRPWLLTTPGSVFVCTYKEEESEEVAKLVNEWRQLGLPLPPMVKEAYNLDDKKNPLWKQCPFLPENGYGEIAVNLETHFSRMPEEQKTKPTEAMEVHCGQKK